MLTVKLLVTCLSVDHVSNGRAAEMEILVSRIAERPMAFGPVQLHERAAFAGDEFLLLVAEQREIIRRYWRPFDRLHPCRRNRIAALCRWPLAGRLFPSRQSKPVDFADNSVAGNATQLRR